MNILITGGLGTIGRPLTTECRRRGHAVVTCDLTHGPDERTWSAHADSSRASYARCDVGDFRQLERVLEYLGPFDMVYHCAAEFGRWNGEDYYEQLWRTNAIGTKHQLRLQRDLGFRVVYFSSSEVYGDWPDTMFESTTDNYPIQQLSDYAMSKWVGEMQVRNSTIQFGTETVIVRLFNTYGPGEYYSPYRSVNCRFLYCALHGVPWTVHLGHARTSTYVDDTVRTLANIADVFKPGEVYNISGNALHSIAQLSDIVLDVTGAARSLVWYEDQEICTTGSKKPDNTKAVRDLGHRDTYTLERGLVETMDWMKSVYRETIRETVNLHGHVPSTTAAPANVGEYLPTTGALGVRDYCGE